MSAPLDPITMAVVKSALDSIVDEMGATVMRTARSPIVRDVLDYSATLCDRHGQIVAQAKTVALHIGAVPDAMAEIQARFGDRLQPGDVIVLNDPYAGGMHLPDIFMVKPIFHAGALRGYSVVVAHQCDMGGRVPGSNASDSTEIYQEGLRIPPLKLYAAGRRDETLVALIRTNVRVPDLVMGDIDAQLAACSIGEREFVKLLDRYGVAETERYIAALIDYAERMTRRAIAAWPKGTWRFEDFIDDDGFSEEPIPIRVAITVREDSLLVDYSGSSPQVKGAINSTLSFVKSATYLSVRCALDRDLPNNAGLFRCIEVRAPKGSILDPHLPAPVAARALTGYRVVDAMFGCLAQIVPDRIPAAGEGGNTVVCIGGWLPDRTPFIVVDMINGCWGGRPTKDGIEGVTNPSQNMSNGPVEVLEATAPIRIERYGYRPDSGGAGRWRGGLGLIREYRLLAEEAILQVRSDRRRFAPWGLAGGLPGAPTRNTLDPDGAARDLPGKFTMTMRKGDLFRHEQAGGGGHGAPLLRDARAVADDLAEGKVGKAYARSHHGLRDGG